METFTNLGPIVDMCVVDLERQGQGQVRGHLERDSWYAHSNCVLGLLTLNGECALQIRFESLTH